MRLSEKTIELNFCAQLNSIYRGRIIWFGLTQRQEARLGFDTCTRMGGKLLLFQFKASNQIVGNARRFYASHTQLQNLIGMTNHFYRSVFYVLPSIGTTLELFNHNGNVIANTWLLDVATLPNPFPHPYTRNGTLRRNGCHYIDLHLPTASHSAKAIIHSDPIEVDLISAEAFFSQGLTGSDGLNRLFDGFDHFYEYTRNLKRNSLGAIVLPEE